MAKKIFALTKKKRMPLRTRIGLDAKMTYFFQRLMPSNLRIKLFARMFNRLLVKNA